jgi:hypothetical protein
MKDFINNFFALIPFLEPYPNWVKVLLSLWIALSAIIIIVLLFFRTGNPPSIDVKQKTEIPKQVDTPQETLPTTPGDASLKEMKYVTDPAYSPVTLEQFHQTYYSESLTQLQQEHFVEGLMNKRVIWEGTIKSVETDSDGKQVTIKIISPENERWLAFMKFPRDRLDELLRLKVGQKIRVTGILRNVVASPFVRECSIVRVWE